MKDNKKYITEDEWNENEIIYKNTGDRNIHIKEIDEKLGMNYEYYSKTNKNGKTIYVMRNLNLSSWILTSLFLIGVTIACLSNFFNGQLEGNVGNYILLVFITVLLIIGDVWSIYNLIDIIKINKKNKKIKTKKNILSSIFSILRIVLIILLIIPFLFMLLLSFTKNLNINIDEKYVIIYAILFFGIGILEFILQIILAFQGWTEHKKENKNNKD